MSYKFDSLIIILNKLNSRAKINVESLGEELEVGKRTVYRYMRSLQTAGFPIEYDRDSRTYIFSDGYTLNKPNVSVEEALAFSLAKKLLRNLGPAMEKSLCCIEGKLAIGKRADAKHIFLTSDRIPGHTEEYLKLIHSAITDHRKMKINYKGFSATEAMASVINPYYLFFSNGLWYFRGVYDLDTVPRTFALDRIESLSILDRNFLPPHLKPEEELSGAFGAFLDGEPVDVILTFDKTYKPLITRKTWHASQRIVDLPDGGIEVTFTVRGILGIRNWIYQWIPHVKVMAPQELRDMFRDDLGHALKQNR